MIAQKWGNLIKKEPVLGEYRHIHTFDLTPNR